MANLTMTMNQTTNYNEFVKDRIVGKYGQQRSNLFEYLSIKLKCKLASEWIDKGDNTFVKNCHDCIECSHVPFYMIPHLKRWMDLFNFRLSYIKPSDYKNRHYLVFV